MLVTLRSPMVKKKKNSASQSNSMFLKEKNKAKKRRRSLFLFQTWLPVMVSSFISSKKFVFLS